MSLGNCAEPIGHHDVHLCSERCGLPADHGGDCRCPVEIERGDPPYRDTVAQARGRARA